jgi:hypothetical protein
LDAVRDNAALLVCFVCLRVLLVVLVQTSCFTVHVFSVPLSLRQSISVSPLSAAGADGSVDALAASHRAQTHQLQLLSASVTTLVARHEQSRKFAARLFAFLARWAPAAIVIALLAAQHRARIVAWIQTMSK